MGVLSCIVAAITASVNVSSSSGMIGSAGGLAFTHTLNFCWCADHWPRGNSIPCIVWPVSGSFDVCAQHILHWHNFGAIAARKNFGRGLVVRKTGRKASFWSLTVWLKKLSVQLRTVIVDTDN